jgi:hypothetical protein
MAPIVHDSADDPVAVDAAELRVVAAAGLEAEQRDVDAAELRRRGCSSRSLAGGVVTRKNGLACGVSPAAEGLKAAELDRRANRGVPRAFAGGKRPLTFRTGKTKLPQSIATTGIAAGRATRRSVRGSRLAEADREHRDRSTGAGDVAEPRLVRPPGLSYFGGQGAGLLAPSFAAKSFAVTENAVRTK